MDAVYYSEQSPYLIIFGGERITLGEFSKRVREAGLSVTEYFNAIKKEVPYQELEDLRIKHPYI